MTPAEIISELQSRGNRNIRFHEDGRITGWFGKHTLNTWVLQNGQLIATDCRTIG